MAGTPSSTAVTPGTGDNIAEWTFTESSTTKKIQRNALSGNDGSDITGTAADAAAPQTDTTALSWTSILKQLSLSLQAIASATVRVAVTPTVTASTYAASVVVGGIMTFASILPASPYNAMLQSVTVKFKGSVQTVGFWVAIFSASPSGTAFTNASPAAITSADTALLLGMYHLYANSSSMLGTHTILNLDGIGKALEGSSTSLYVVVVPDGTTAALGSTSDMTVELGVLWG